MKTWTVKIDEKEQIITRWTVEIDGDWTDWADCTFYVFANSYKEAWRKALVLEDKKKIIRIY